MSLKIEGKLGNKLIARYMTDGLCIQTEYPSGKKYPAIDVNISWEEWERFVAWVELQRKEEALENTKNP
jgi:hypothetical protein